MPFRITTVRAARRVATSRPTISARNFQTSTPIRARVASQDKDSINREAYEYTRSGTDSNVAQNEKAAFDPKTTRPDEEMSKAGEGNEGKDKTNPLEYSPANEDMSPTNEAAEGGPRTSGEDRTGKKQSGYGGPSKAKDVTKGKLQSSQ